MSLLVPLGLLGLSGILALILIYILKPNYQQRLVSSSYIWKLSLKYRKKRIYTSRLLNLLLILCQVLIIAACAFILAQPVVLAEATSRNAYEKIAVIDASANMLAEQDGVTRFERAVDGAYALAEETLVREEAAITVILAGSSASYVVYRADMSMLENVLDEIDALGSGELQCSYATADVDAAMSLAQTILDINPSAEVLFYTGTEYINEGRNVTVVDVSADGEWNAALLNVTTSQIDNHYVFNVEAACYGRNVALTVNFEVYGANTDGSTIKLSCVLDCLNDETTVYLFDPAGDEISSDKREYIYSYDRVRVFISEEDSLSFDNEFYLYGGTVETIKVQYASSLPNNFVQNMLSSLRNTLRQRYNIAVTEVQTDGSSASAVPSLSGFDIYIFEHTIPSSMPTDGVVILINPLEVPYGADFVLGGTVTGDFLLSSGESHSITSGVRPESITVSRYTQITLYDGYVPLLYCGEDPVLLLKDDDEGKILLMPFSLNYSNLPVLFDYLTLMYNTFNYFIPSTVTGSSGETGYVYEVNEDITLNARGSVLKVTYGDGTVLEYADLPVTVRFSVPGTYTLQQETLNGDKTEYIYVKAVAAESNIFRVVDQLPNPTKEDSAYDENEDLLFYLALALVALLFAEWWLQSRDRI